MPGGAKHWCFTHNNYTDCDIEYYHDIGSKLAIPARPGRRAKKLVYLVYGREVGDSGTPHVQGYVVFDKRTSIQGARKALPGAHVEIARGTPRQASEYCKKDGVFDEFGTCPAVAGKRSDLEALGRAVLSGASAQEIQDQFPGAYIRYKHNIDRCVREQQPARDWPVDVRVFWGETGTGKTRSVYEFIRREDIYVHPGGSWFDGYEGQTVVLFDDYTGSCFKIGYLLKLLDRYPMRVPVKGGFVQFAPKHIFFTSNLDPKEWYPNAHRRHVEAMFRRINTIQHFA